MSGHSHDLARKRLLLVEIDRIVRQPYLSYGDVVRRIGELVEQQREVIVSDGSRGEHDG